MHLVFVELSAFSITFRLGIICHLVCSVRGNYQSLCAFAVQRRRCLSQAETTIFYA